MVGVGTFAGPRLLGARVGGRDEGSGFGEGSGRNLRGPVGSVAAYDGETESRKLVRLAVVMAGLKHLTNTDWWFGPFLEGIDSASSKHGVVVEFLGSHLTNPDLLAQRLGEHRPDVFVCFGPPTASEAGIVAIAEVRRRKIPCILSCVPTPELAIPSVHEDAVPGTAAAVKHLYDLGHRRIAFVQVMNTGWWIFDRYEGYRQGLLECGLCTGDETALWLPQIATEETAARLRDFLRGQNATAVILGSQWAAANMQWLTRDWGIRIPDDLSVISLDQKPDVAGWLGGVQPTRVEVPLKEIGRTVAEYARRLAEGRRFRKPRRMPTSWFMEKASGRTRRCVIGPWRECSTVQTHARPLKNNHYYPSIHARRFSWETAPHDARFCKASVWPDWVWPPPRRPTTKNRLPGLKTAAWNRPMPRSGNPSRTGRFASGSPGYGRCRFGAAFSFQDHPNVEVVAVTDLIPDRCAGLAKACRCKKTYPSLEKMIEDDSIEAVFLATDAPNHAPQGVKVLKKGKHVASAVPACFETIEQGEELLEAVKTSGKKYMMFETSMFHANLYAMRQAYRAGAFGKIVYSEGEYYHFGVAEYNFGSYKRWRHGCPPMWYPTHNTAYHVGVTDGTFTEVSCRGFRGDLPENQPGVNRWKNPFDTEVALFATSEGGHEPSGGRMGNARVARYHRPRSR